MKNGVIKTKNGASEKRKGAIMTSFKTLIKKLQSLGWFFLGHVKKCENYYLSGHLKIVEV